MDLSALAEASEARAARAMAMMLRGIRGAVSRDDLAAVISRSSAYEVTQRILGAQNFQAAFIPAFTPIGEVFLRAGDLAGKAGVKAPDGEVRKYQVTFDFDRVNPDTIRVARDFRNRLIREVAADVADTTQMVVMDGLAHGRAPDEIAADLTHIIGLTRRQAQAVLNYRRQLQDLSRAALDRKLRDRRFDATTEAAIATGEPLAPEQIDKQVSRYAERYLAYRATTIARTETLRAANAGAMESYRQADENGVFGEFVLRRFWVHTHDNKTRPDHKRISELNADGVGMDEPFEYPGGRTIMLPGDPNAEADMVVNCRCTIAVRLVRKGD